MSWGGFAQYANQMMRANREQLKKRKSRNREILDELHEGTAVNTPLEFKEVSAEELYLIKEEIRERAQKSQNRDMLLYAIFSIIVLVIVVRIMLATFS